jgi:hypothetical protein
MTQDMSQDNARMMLGLQQYAAAAGVSERTVKRWLKDNELRGAIQDARGRWMIPADAERVVQASDIAPIRPETPIALQTYQRTTPPTAPAEIVAQLPGFVQLEHAATVLGIPETAIRRNRDHFDLQPFGPHGALVMPRHRILEILG